MVKPVGYVEVKVPTKQAIGFTRMDDGSYVAVLYEVFAYEDDDDEK